MPTTLSTQNLAFQKKNINGIKGPTESNVSYKCRLVWGVPVSFISHLFFLLPGTDAFNLFCIRLLTFSAYLCIFNALLALTSQFLSTLGN